MSEAGIITQFHNSINYGGVLQAYALCRAIRDFGIDAEQIRYIPSPPEEYSERKSFVTRLLNLFKPAILEDYLYSKMDELRNNFVKDVFAQRREAFERFGHTHIPQSSRVYSAGDIHLTVTEYDHFITGSDQVWNLNWFQSAYFLDFVPAEKTKISYAASLGMRDLNRQQRMLMKSLLADFSAVSVREEDAVSLVQPSVNVPVECVLDPTMLLSAQQWDEICGERLVQEPYLFCYFLGPNKQLRTIAKQYARAHGLKIVTIPHAMGRYTEGEAFFGDIRIKTASPVEFLSLIKYADCVCTNSFHAAVFSGIYEKQYFVFPRKKGDQMISRIHTLMNYFGSASHFCDTEEMWNVDYLNHAKPICYVDQSLFAEQKEKSLGFLEKNLVKKL